MNKMIAVALGLLVLAGAGGYLVMNRTRTREMAQDKSGEGMMIGQNKDNGQGVMNSLREAMTAGVGMKCTYSVDGNEYEGYVKGNQYRGRVSTAEGTGQVIVKDNCVWSWSDDEDQGITMCYESEEGEESDIWENPQTGLDMNLNYNCVTASVGDSEFTPPENVEFVDLEGMMNGMMQGQGY